MNNVEAALHIWKRKVEALKRAQAESRSALDNIQLLRGTFQIREARLLGLEKRQMLMERAESFLFLLRLKFPGMPQTILDVCKIQYCKVRNWPSCQMNNNPGRFMSSLITINPTEEPPNYYN
jgi:hypothetical protein